MVLLLYLWENLKKWSSNEEMRLGSGRKVDLEAHQAGLHMGAGGMGGGQAGMSYDPNLYNPHGGGPHDYQQMGGLRRLDSATLRSHYYPEGGWGWIVCACAFLAHVTTSGAQLSAGALHIVLANKFQDSYNAQHWLGPFSWSVSSVCSPLVVNLCRRKNVRILSFVGGCLFPLSLVCTAFATEMHQIFFSFGLLGGLGSCLVRESSSIVLGEYFRRRRQFVEQVVLAGTGVGVTLFSLLYLSLGRHIEWAHGFHIGASLSLICALLPAFYRAAAIYHPHRTAIQQFKQQKAQRQGPTVFLPLGGDICHSLNLFCVPALKPILWSAAISSFGLYAPVFLMSDFGKSEGLSGGSLLLLQTHLGLGLSLGVILGAILTLKKFRCCHVSPRMLACFTGMLTGLSMIAISSVKGYYGYSLSAWFYGIALGSYLYTLKILTMELTRTKHWERIWSCVQSIMGPGVLLGTGLTSFLGKSGFYACATCVLLGSAIIGLELIDLSKCGSPQLSSLDNESPIPPAPPPIAHNRYGQPIHMMNSQQGQQLEPNPGFYPLRRSVSLTQPMIYPCCPVQPGLQDYSGYSPFCPDCNPPQLYPPIVRSHSLPHPELRNTGTQTNPNSPETPRRPMTSQSQPGSFEQRHHHHPQQMGSSLRRSGTSSHKNSVMFASNPQLFPQTHTHQPQQHAQPRSTRSSAERFPDLPIEPQFFPLNEIPLQQQKPAFTRHYFDSSQIAPNQRRQQQKAQQQPQQGAQAQHGGSRSQVPEKPPGQNTNSRPNNNGVRQQTTQPQQHQPPFQAQQQPSFQPQQPPFQSQQPPFQPNHVQQGVVMDPRFYYHDSRSNSQNSYSNPHAHSNEAHYHHHHHSHQSTSSKVSDSEFDVSQPQFHSLRRPHPHHQHHTPRSGFAMTGNGAASNSSLWQPGQSQSHNTTGQKYEGNPGRRHP